MSATITLPLSLRSRLTAIRRRARLLRAVRGLGLLVIVLGLSGAAALLADYVLDLSAATRQILFCVWLGEAVLLLLFSIVVPLGRRLDAAALAAVIEQQHPDLGERLTSAVELSEAPVEGHGSPLLIALLMDETEKQSTGIDFRPAVPARRAGIVAALAAVVVLLAAAPAFVWPRQYDDLTQRFFRPWNIAAAPAPYTLEVAPGDVIAGRGRTVTVSAHLTPRNDSIALPAVSTLVAVDASGKETRQTMEQTGAGEFTLAYKVPGGVTYRIEAGEVVSDWYRVTAVVPVELAADSPRITVTPPEYARKVKEEETFHGLVALSPLQHSEVRFDFRFTRPAVAAYLEWITANKTAPSPPTPLPRSGGEGRKTAPSLPTPHPRSGGEGSNLTPLSPPGGRGVGGEGGSVEQVVRHSLTLSDDQLTASFRMPATSEGKYRVVLEAEHNIQTLLPGGAIQVRPDQPPSVVKFKGKEELRVVLPYERVPLEIETADDIAVAGVELEYRVNDGEPVRVPATLEGGDTPSAIARHTLELAGKVKPDDQVHYHFRARDNLPKEYKGPHVIVYPPDRWLTLRVIRHGDPLQQKEILAQRDEINRKLSAIREALLQEKRGVYKVKQETRRQETLPPEDAQRVKQLQEDNRASQKALREVAQVAEATPAMQPISDKAREVADQEMHESQKALDQTPRQSSPRERDRELARADEQLDSAVKKLDELKKENDRLAQERLDQAKLEMLADREKHLAEQAAELAAKHPVLDPTAKQQAEQIKREQAEVAAELDRMAQQSEPLKQALEQARAEESRQLAERARELAQAQRDLAKAETETQRQRNADRLEELARKQQELAEKEAALARQTRQPAETMKTNPLKPEESQRAAEALKQGDPQKALKHQDEAARDLERLAQALDRAVKVSADPKEAARQLAQAEKALRQRVEAETAKKDEKQPLTERLQPLHAEQKAIRQAAEQVSVPPTNPDANKVKRQIAERAGQAEDALRKQDAPQAQTRMEETRKLLDRLADQLPNLEQRRRQARQEAERLRRQQDEIARQVEQIKKDDPSAAQRLADAARRQAEVAEAVSKMDAPKQEERRERTTDALNRALADLMNGRRVDTPASQQEARRQLERLEQALRGEKPADERARDLARQQRELAQDAARAAADPKATPPQKQEIQRKQQLVAEQTGKLPAPEAPQRQREAAEATRQAAQAAQAQPAAPETQKRMEEAARKLDELARQMAGAESDAAKAERLARRQADEATESERQPGKPTTPQAQQRQQEIGREAQQVRGGEEARKEKQRALDALARAEKAPAKEQARARREAADALRDLADHLAGRDNPAAKASEIARQQQDLAREAAKAEAGKPDAQQTEEVTRRQADLKRQVERLDGKAAPQAAKEAGEKMAQAAKALDSAKSPAEAKEALDHAAAAAEKLVEKLGEAQAKKPVEASGETTSAKPASQSPRQMAQEAARQQRQLAQATQQTADRAGQAGTEATRKAMQQLAKQQHELGQQASQVPARQAQRGLEQARAAMNKAEEALAKNDSTRARQKQIEAADALDRLAKQLPTEIPPMAKRDPQEAPAATPRSLPSKEQTEQAQQLARQQRALRDAVQRATQTAAAERPVLPDNPIGELSRQQAEVARQAAEMARNVEREQGEKSPVSRQAHDAEQSARQASRQMQSGALPQARKAGQQSAEQLRQLTAQLARTPRGKDADAPDPLDQARQLGRQQEEINRRLQPLADDARTQAAQQQAQQRGLQQEAGELSQQLGRMAQQAKSPQQSALQRAAAAGQQAQNAMQQARNQAQQGQAAAEQQSQERAAQLLDQAARDASQAASPPQQAAAKPGSESASKPGSPKAGESMAQARQQMTQAQGQLNQGRPGQAQASMKQAAQSLAQAAKQMAADQQQQPGKPGQPGQPIGLGRIPGGLPDLTEFGLDKASYAEKSWGELPGEVRTRITQAMKARYGEDYARMIKYYFEEIASTPPTTKGAAPPASALPRK